MDSYKTLFERESYDLILSLTEGDQTADSLFYRSLSFLALGKVEDAKNTLLKNEDYLYKEKPLLYMKSIFKLRFATHDFRGALDDFERFRNLPYVSQEVEEFLKEAPELLSDAIETNPFTSVGGNIDIKGVSTSDKSDFQVLATLGKIDQSKLKDYIPDIISIVSSDRSAELKTYALLMLIAAGCKETVIFKKGRKTFKVIPDELIPPFVGRLDTIMLKRIASYGKDTSLRKTMNDLFNNYVLAVYPRKSFSIIEEDLFFGGLLALARDYLGFPSDLAKIEKQMNLEEEDLIKKRNAIEKAIRENNTIPLEE